MALSELQILFRQCLHRRVSAIEFRQILEQYKLRQKVKSRDVVSTFVNCCLDFCVEGDPLLPGYLQEILVSRSASLPDFVAALTLQWQNLKDSQKLERIISGQIRLLTDLNIFLATANPTIDQPQQCIVITARWLTAMARWALDDHMKDNLNVHNLTEVVGILLISQLNFNSSTRAPDVYTAIQQATDQCMGAFPSISMELMNRLSTMQKSEEESMQTHIMDMAAIQFEEGIMQTTVVATRSGTTALIQHLLSTGSTIDDSVVYSFLSTRHSGNHAVMFNDLVFASIDAMIKGPPNDMYQNQCRVFILNKLPFILAYIVTSSFESFSSEQNLINAWNYISTQDTTTGQRFLQICAFHHLISSESASSLVGEDIMLKGLYAKDDVVAQVASNHTRGPRLVDELLRNDGNSGSITQAIYEIMTNYCHMRETQHLKEMANMIVRKPASINTIGMFIKPALFLTSFCTLLDQWKWDDIHGESQPIYDEFGSVFLLVLAFRARLRLTDAELGIQQKGFLARYFSSKNTELRTEAMQKHLGDWIKSLYIDEGLSDELTSNCSAQDFYMLIPTLLRQSVTAHFCGKLSHETLKAGLEYLLEPFLLPSLLPAFGWIEHISSTEPKTAQLVLKILNKPPGGEAKEIHQTILAMARSFAISVPEGDLTQIATETYTSLAGFVRKYGTLQVVHTLVSMLLEGDFHTLLDFVATMIVISDLQSAVQVVHGKLGQYLKKNENLYAEAVVHLARRVELYANALTSQDLGIESFVPMNVTNVNLDAVPEILQEQNEDIDQVLNEAAAMGMDQLDSTNLDDMYELQANDFGLGNLDDLDLDMDMF